jgi:hypothetical protein
MHDVLAHALESRSCRFESGDTTADHDRQAAGNRPDFAAGNRRVEEVDSLSRRRAAMSRAAAGRMVLMSTATSPARAALATPCSPSITCSTSGASATIEITKSTTAGHPGGTVSRAGAGVEQGLHRLGTTRPDGQFMPRAAGSAPSGAP